MYSKLPIFSNKLYTKSSDHQELYDRYQDMLSGRNPTTEEELLFKSINIIYNDYVDNGFGNDWDKDLNNLISILDDNQDLNHLISYLDSIKKYSRGYKITDEEIIQVGDDLETVFCEILDYIDEPKIWKKLKMEYKYD